MKNKLLDINRKVDPLKISEYYGIQNISEVIYNPKYDELFIEETKPDLVGYERGIQTNLGAIAIDTGLFTGRSPKDKYIVYDDVSMNTVWWFDKNSNSSDNKPITKDIWKILKKVVLNHLFGKRLFIVDAFCSSNVSVRLKVRFILEIAWQAHFIKNMFIQPTEEELLDFNPDFVLINAAKCVNKNWKIHGLNSENFIAFNLKEKMQIIGGTWYNGEIKKGLFSIMNYLLPLQGIASMHCSANIGKKDDVAIFFGLSGTGKTTLSMDKNRKLIGDDEHGWGDDGIFNLEGGCYAKTINLSKSSEPMIYSAIKENALLENVVVSSDGFVDFHSSKKTENTRVSYPLSNIKNVINSSYKIGHAERIIFLTADAFAVFPILSCLNQEQAEYYFLSGFTTKLPDTEKEIKKPVPFFSACFGSAFLTLHPIKYVEILSKRMKNSKSKAYLINTGWDKDFKRISIKTTRMAINFVLSGKIDRVEKKKIPIFNLHIPTFISGIKNHFLDPRLMYKNYVDWELKAKYLANKFIENFKIFKNTKKGKYLNKFGPKI